MKAGLLLCGAGIAVNAWLLFLKSSHGIAGCGDSCGDVLSSRWSFVFGVAVPWFGIAAYVMTAIALGRRRASLLAACLTILAGSVVWFVSIQAIALQRFCPWCLFAHGIAMVAVVAGTVALRRMPSPRWPISLAGGATALLLLILAQLHGPAPATHRIEEGPAIMVTGDIHSRGTGRKVSFDGGAKTYDVEALPRLGPADAKHVLVEYFDYQCPACRTMHEFLESLREKHPDDIAVVVLPVPLERSCNRLLGPNDTQHRGSCELSDAALAVWRADPAAFGIVHRALLADPLAGLRLAREKAPAGNDPWINGVLKTNTEDWIAFSSTSKHLPKLLITGRRVLHGLPSGKAEFIRVLEHELGLEP